MAGRAKVWTAIDFLLFSELNNEFDILHNKISNPSGLELANGTVTEVKLASDASPAVYFAELFNKDEMVVDGLTFASSTGLSVTVTSGTAYIFDGTTTPNKLKRVSRASASSISMIDNATNFIDITSAGAITTTTSATVPANATRLMEVVTSGGVVTGNTDLRDLNFFEQNAAAVDYAEGILVEFTSISTATIIAGSSKRDLSNRLTLEAPSNLVLNMAIASVPLGRDQGSETSSTWYAVCLIGDTTGSLAVSGLLVAESDWPGSFILPTGFDVIGRIGWVRNNSSSNIQQFQTQNNHTVYLEDAEVSMTTSTGTTTMTDINGSPFFPPTCRLGLLSLDLSAATGAGDTIFHWDIAGTTGTPISRKGLSIRQQAGDILRAQYTGLHVALDTSQDFAFYTAGGVNAFEMIADGYIDNMKD